MSLTFLIHNRYVTRRESVRQTFVVCLSFLNKVDVFTKTFIWIYMQNLFPTLTGSCCEWLKHYRHKGEKEDNQSFIIMNALPEATRSSQ